MNTGVSFLIWIAVLGISLSSSACALSPGGNTVGGGFSSPIEFSEPLVILDCGGIDNFIGCEMDLCVTVKNHGRGRMTVSLSRMGGTPSAPTPVTKSQKLVLAETVKTVCDSGIARVMVDCESADRCEVSWRVDQVTIEP